MISSETRIKLKRSGIAGRVPTLADLQLGELGINYNDGRIFFRQENDIVGSRIIEPGQGAVIGKTIFVSVEGNDNNSGLNERDAKRSIKSAASIAEPGDSIKVYPGQYVEDNPIRFRDRVSVEGMELRNVLVTPANPSKDLYQVGDGFHATNHSFVSNQDSTDGAAIITFRPLEGTASDRYFDAARLIRDNLDFIASESVGFLTSGYSGYAADQRSQDGARAIELNKEFIVEEAFQHINSPDYKGPSYFNPDPAQCRRDLGDILDGWRYDLISDGNSESTGVGLTYYAPIKFFNQTNITDLVYDNVSGLVAIETKLDTQVKVGDEIQLEGIRLDCGPYGNENFIVDFNYDNTSGIATITLPFLHNIEVDDNIKLDNLKFDCPPYGAKQIGITDFVYDETTGSSIITLESEHDLSAGDGIELRDLQFDCPSYGGQYTDVVNLDYNNVTGKGVVFFEDAVDLISGDKIYLYDIKMNCPPYGNAISVTDFKYDNFTGISEVTSARPHGLVPGDLVKLENLKFTCDSYLDEDFNIIGFDYNNLTGDSIVTLNKNHSFVTGNDVEIEDLVFACNSYIPTGLGVTSFNYTANTGVSTITLIHQHSLQIGDQFRLEDLTFACNSYTTKEYNVTAAFYEEQTGFVTVEIDGTHTQQVGSRVRLDGLEFSCVNSGITTTIFPDGTIGNEFEILSTPNNSSFIVNVGTSSIAHDYVSGGTATLGITTTTFPDGTQGFDFEVTGLIDEFTVETNVGVSSIAHEYVGGGKLFVGFTTTVFPDGTQGNTFSVSSIPSGNQIIINVGVSTIAHDYISGGTLSSADRFQQISDFQYNKDDGTALITLPRNHNLVVGESFVVEGAKFRCDSYRQDSAANNTITNVVYDGVSGVATITVGGSHDLVVDDTFALYDIEFTCDNSTGITTTIFPSGERDNFYDVLSVLSPSTIVTQVGKSSINHTYVSGGVLQTGLTTSIFPNGSRDADNIYDVIEVPAPNQIRTTVGVSSIAHTYIGQGKFYSGITTNIFPQTFEDPNIRVTNAVYDNVTGRIEITTDKAHGLVTNGPVLLQGLEFSCASGGPGGGSGSLVFPRNQEVYLVQNVVNTTTYICNVGPSDFAHTYVQGGISTPQNITNAIYNEITGDLTVTVNKAHGYKANDKASIVDLVFSCTSGGPGNAPGTLIFPRPTDEFEVLAVNGNQIITNVGPFPGLPHTYIGGGSVSYNGTTISISGALYDEETGQLSLDLPSSLSAPVGATFVMQGLRFDCESGGPGNDPGTIIFPRLDVPVYKVKSVPNQNSYVINVGPFPGLPHTYAGGGFSSLKKRVNDQNIFKVTGVPSPTKLITKVGVSSIAHDYVSGGNLFTGITTNFFPDGTRADGNSFEVISPLTPNSALINIGVSSIPHTYESGGRMQYGETNELDIIDFQYDNRTGLSTVIVRGDHRLSAGQNVKLDGLEFECTNSPGITTTIFPDGTAASFNIYPVNRIVSTNTFETNVGRVDFQHTYLRGGSAFTGITTNIFPDGTQGFVFQVGSVVSPTKISVNVGVSSIQHDYIRGGQLFAGRTNERSIKDFKYDHVSGLAILTLRQPERDLFTGDLVKLKDLEFTCAESVGITTTIFPDTDKVLFPITERLNQTQFQLDIGPSPFAHEYVRGTGNAFVGITTDIFPDGTRGKIFSVVDIPAPNKVAAKIGVSSIPHNYIGGGTLSVGINTDIFPGDPEVSPRGDIYVVENITNAGELIINVGPSSITHTYADGGIVKFGESAGGELQHITGPGVKEATIAAIEFEKEMSKYALNNRPWGSFITQETARVVSFDYDAPTGFATVTAPGINVQANDTVRMSDIQFKCSDEYAGLTTTFFPDGTRPDGNYFTVENRVDEDTFEIFVGVSSIAHNYDGGGNVYRYRQNIADVNYDRISGVADVTSIGHGFNPGDIVELGDIRFNCDVFTPDYDIENFEYNNVTGLSVVTTTVDNDIKVGDLVRLDDIQFACPPYGNNISITGFVYDNATGISTVTTAQPHGLIEQRRAPVGIQTAVYDNVSGILTVTTSSNINFTDLLSDGVILDDLNFSCNLGSEVYPTTNGYIYSLESYVGLNQFSVNVGSAPQPHEYLGGGTAQKTNRNDVKLSSIKFECPPYGNSINITNFLYDNFSGNSLVTVDRAHKLSVGDSVKLADIKFQCAPYNNQFNVLDADYDTVSGILTISADRNITGVQLGEEMRVSGLQFDCSDSGPSYPVTLVTWDPASKVAKITTVAPGVQPGDTIKLTNLTYRIGSEDFSYPDGRDESLNLYRVLTVEPTGEVGQPGGSVDIRVKFAKLTEAFIVFVPSGTDYGTAVTGITTNIYPSDVGKEGGFYPVQSFPADNQVEFQVGVSSIGHDYVRFGSVFSGVTTSFFPDKDPQNSPKGDIYRVIDIPAPNQVRINVGVSSISHVYDEGGSLFVGVTTNIFPDGTQGDIFPVVSVLNSTELLVNVGASSIPHNYVSGGELFTGITTNIFPGNSQNSPRGNIFEVLDKDEMCPDRFTINVGPSSISHNYVDGGTVTTGVTTDRFPDGTNGYEFEVLNIVDVDTFKVNVGPSTISHSYVEGGFTRKIKSPVDDLQYTNISGVTTITAGSHKLNVGDLVKIEDVKFDCDPYGTEKMISNFVYDAPTGRATVTTTEPHGLTITETIKLSSIQMDCAPYGNQKNITNAVYDNSTGVLIVQTLEAHGLTNGENVKLDGLEFNCSNSGITTTIFPDGTAASLNLYRVNAVTGANSFEVNVGVSSIIHTYVSGGNAFVGITTNIFPGNKRNSPKGSFFQVLDTPSSTSFSINVGVSSIAHSYVRDGFVQVGVTTDIFPDGTQGEYFKVLEVLDEDNFRINAGVSSIAHRYNSGGYISKYATYQSKNPQIIDEHVIRVSRGCEAVEARLDQLSNIVTGIIDQGPGCAPGGLSANVISASYTKETGALVIGIDQDAALQVNDVIDVRNLIFECDKRSNVIAASYDRFTGRLVVKTDRRSGAEVGLGIFLEGLEFSCGDGSLVYPEDPSKKLFVDKVNSETEFEVVLTPSTKFHSYVGGGKVRTEKTRRTYPDNKVFQYRIAEVVSSTRFIINVGASDITHTYVSGGVVKLGERINVINAEYDTRSGLLKVTTEKPNNFVEDTGVQLNGLIFSCTSGGERNLPGQLPFPDNRPANVVDSVYNNVTGVLRVTTDKPHQLYRNAKVSLEGLEFRCNTGISVYPIGSSTAVVNAQYNNESGQLRVTTSTPHGLSTTSRVRLSGMRFSCVNGDTQYPTDTLTSFAVESVEDSVTYTIQLTPSTLPHTYLGGGISSNSNIKPFKVTKVNDNFTYEVQLETSNTKHTYVRGGTSNPGPGNYRIAEVISPSVFTVQMAPFNLPHTYVGGGTAASVFTQQEQTGINLRTSKCADDIKKIYLAVVHDITRGGNMKAVDAAKRYYDALEQIKFIAGAEVEQTVDALDFSLNVVRNVINNVSWGGVPRGYLTSVRKNTLLIPPSTQTSVVRFNSPLSKAQYTTSEKVIESFIYNNLTGIASVRTNVSHDLRKYDPIRLSDLEFRCTNSPGITTTIFPDGTQGDIFEVDSVIEDNSESEVIIADYNNVTGEMTILTVEPHGIPVGSKVGFEYLRFICNVNGSNQIATYPKNIGYSYVVERVDTPRKLTVNVGISTIVHTWSPIAQPIIGQEPRVVERSTSFTVHVGTVNFPHVYLGNGTVWQQAPFSRPETATQLRDVSIQDDPIQRSNATPNACANVFSAIENTVGVVTTIIAVGPDDAGIPTRYPGNDGKGVDTIEEMTSQGVGNIIKGPYIRNCTNFVPKSIGMRMDGFDAEPGDEISNGVQGSSNVDSFTQFNPGGVGCSISNGTYQQLVSIFTICCDEAIVCDSGAQLDLTNSNSSFGRLGLVARGIGDAQSKCIDRYTGIVAVEAEIEDDTVVIAGVGNKRPYDGQGIFFGELFREVIRIDVTDQGSGYDDLNPPFAFVDEPTGPSGIKAEVSPTVRNGKVVSIEVISNGNQYRDKTPTVTINPPKRADGRQAKAVAVTEPLYYDVDSSSEPSEGTVTVVFKQRLNNTVSIGTTVFFSRLSLQIASSHSFEYIGAGNEIDGARPSQGGVPIKENEVVKVDGGSIVYTSTDQAGNFNIGDDFVINQFTGTVTGRSFDQSVLNKVTPLIIALDS